MKKIIGFLSAALIAMLVANQTASATIINDFNLIALGNLDGTNEVEGRALVIGNVDLPAAQIAFDGNALSNPTTGVTTPGLDQDDGLVVGGTILAGSTLNLGANNPNVRVRGSDAGATVTTSGTITYGDGGVDAIINTVISEIASLDGFLSGLTANSTVDDSDRNQIKFTSNSVDGISVFDVDSDFFDSNGTIVSWLGDLNSDLFVFRVAGSGSLTTNNGFNVNTQQFNDDSFQEKIIWDFSAYTGDLFFTNGLGGAMFAPDANVNMGTSIEGLVVANNVTLGGEIHMPYLTAELSGSQPVPEPATTLLLGTGIAGLAAVGRRRRK